MVGIHIDACCHPVGAGRIDILFGCGRVSRIDDLQDTAHTPVAVLAPDRAQVGVATGLAGHELDLLHLARLHPTRIHAELGYAETVDDIGAGQPQADALTFVHRDDLRCPAAMLRSGQPAGQLDHARGACGVDGPVAKDGQRQAQDHGQYQSQGHALGSRAKRLIGLGA